MFNVWIILLLCIMQDLYGMENKSAQNALLGYISDDVTEGQQNIGESSYGMQLYRTICSPCVVGYPPMHFIVACYPLYQIGNAVKNYGLPVNQCDGWHKIALMYAAREGNVKRVEELLRLGARPSIVDRYGTDAWISAIVGKKPVATLGVLLNHDRNNGENYKKYINRLVFDPKTKRWTTYLGALLRINEQRSEENIFMLIQRFLDLRAYVGREELSRAIRNGLVNRRLLRNIPLDVLAHVGAEWTTMPPWCRRKIRGRTSQGHKIISEELTPPLPQSVIKLIQEYV